MKRNLLALILLAGLGSSISSAQLKQRHRVSDPFDRYLKSVNASVSEPALMQFARECSVDVSSSQAGFAVSPGSEWMPVGNLSKGLRNLDSDFYSSAEVWHKGDRVVVEIWAISADVGSEVRVYRCFEKGVLLRAEATDWNLPQVEADQDTWGYFRRWERNPAALIRRTKAEFVDEMERPIVKPKLDASGEQSLTWEPTLGPLNELKLPRSTLR